MVTARSSLARLVGALQMDPAVREVLTGYISRYWHLGDTFGCL